MLSLGFRLDFEASPVSRMPEVCRRHFLRFLEARSSASHEKLSAMDALRIGCFEDPGVTKAAMDAL